MLLTISKRKETKTAYKSLVFLKIPVQRFLFRMYSIFSDSQWSCSTAAKHFGRLGDNLQHGLVCSYYIFPFGRPFLKVCGPWSHFYDFTLSQNPRIILSGGVARKPFWCHFPSTPCFQSCALAIRSSEVNHIHRSFGNGVCGERYIGFAHQISVPFAAPLLLHCGFTK